MRRLCIVECRPHGFLVPHPVLALPVAVVVAVVLGDLVPPSFALMACQGRSALVGAPRRYGGSGSLEEGLLERSWRFSWERRAGTDILGNVIRANEL